MNDQSETKGPGYRTPGEDAVIKSSSPAVPSPDMTSKQRLQDPKPVIESIGETPGDDNPALAETIAAQEGKASTADLLAAREGAEEERARATNAPIYQDQVSRSVPHEPSPSDPTMSGWPLSGQDDTAAEELKSPEAQQDFMDSTSGESIELQGRADRVVERASEEASKRPLSPEERNIRDL